MLSFKCDPSQTKLTEYYKLVTEVDLLSKYNRELMKAFDNANKERKRMLDIMLSSSDNKSVESKSFFQLIISNAERNALKHPHGRRHSEVVKKFAMSLFLYAAAGSMAYNFVHQNMPDALVTMSLHCAGKYSWWILFIIKKVI